MAVNVLILLMHGTNMKITHLVYSAFIPITGDIFSDILKYVMDVLTEQGKKVMRAYLRRILEL